MLPAVDRAPRTQVVLRRPGIERIAHRIVIAAQVVGDLRGALALLVGRWTTRPKGGNGPR